VKLTPGFHKRNQPTFVGLSGLSLCDQESDKCWTLKKGSVRDVSCIELLFTEHKTQGMKILKRLK
jgi:hypothetical protein